jgi:hypothetical protein
MILSTSWNIHRVMPWCRFVTPNTAGSCGSDPSNVVVAVKRIEYIYIPGNDRVHTLHVCNGWEHASSSGSGVPERPVDFDRIFVPTFRNCSVGVVEWIGRFGMQAHTPGPPRLP